MHERVIAGDAGGHGFRWTDVEAPTPDEMRALYERFGLPAHLPAEEPRTPRPAVFEEEGFVFVALVGASGDGLGAVRCLVGPDWLLTVHAHPLDGLDAMARTATSPATALAALAKGLVTGIVDAVGRLDDEVAQMEQGRSGTRRRYGGGSATFGRPVLTQRDVLTRLGGEDGPAPRDDPASRSLRNSAERLAGVGVEVERFARRSTTRPTDRQNEVVKRLTVVAAVFLPLTFITGVLRPELRLAGRRGRRRRRLPPAGDRPPRRGGPAAVRTPRTVRLVVATILRWPSTSARRTAIGLRTMKFGGSSVADADKIRNVATRIAAAKESGDAVLAVVSARGKTTDGLVDLAYEISDRPDPREMDMLLSTGRAHLLRPDGDGAPRPGPRRDLRSPARRPGSSPTTPTPRPRSSRSAPTACAPRSTGATSPSSPASRASRPTTTTSRRSAAAAPTPPPSPSPRRSRPTSARSTPTSPASSPPIRASSRAPQADAGQPRGDARDGRDGLEGARAALRGVRPPPPGPTARPLVLLPRGGHLDHEGDPAMEKAIVTGLAHRTDEAKITIAGVQNRPGVAAGSSRRSPTGT